MGMIRRQTADSIKRYVASFLSSTCVIRRSIERRDQHGAVSKESITIGESIPCRIITQRGGGAANAMRIGNRETLVDMYRVVLPLDVDIKQDDQIVIDGAYYQVASIDDKLTDRVFKAVMLIRERDRNLG